MQEVNEEGRRASGDNQSENSFHRIDYDSYQRDFVDKDFNKKVESLPIPGSAESK